jgi:hypothetical protein
VTVVETETRLRGARAIEKTEAQASLRVMQRLAQRGHPALPPPLASDGGSGCAEAMLEVYGQVPEYSGRGRPPTKKQPSAAWQHLRAVKQRDEQGHFIGTDARVIFGEPEAVVAELGVGTVYVERTHLTMRLSSGRLVRKGLGFSKDLGMYRWAAAWDDIVYNLVRPVKTLRQRLSGPGRRKWQPCSPAMAAGLSDHLWSVRELLQIVPLPVVNS